MTEVALLLSIVVVLLVILGSQGLPFILPQSAKDRFLLNSVRTGGFLYARYWLFAGAKPNIRDEHGWSPLQWASFLGDSKTVRKLVEKGADIDSREGIGERPLILAIKNDERWSSDKIEIIKYLLAKGADPTHSILYAKHREPDQHSKEILNILGEYSSDDDDIDG
jgi:ankyrin repeat protein